MPYETDLQINKMRVLTLLAFVKLLIQFRTTLHDNLLSCEESFEWFLVLLRFLISLKLFSLMALQGRELIKYTFLCY